MREADRTIDDLILRADEAQYLAKGAGRGETRTEADLGGGVPIRPDASAAVEAPAKSADGPDTPA